MKTDAWLRVSGRYPSFSTVSTKLWAGWKSWSTKPTENGTYLNLERHNAGTPERRNAGKPETPEYLNSPEFLNPEHRNT